MRQIAHELDVIEQLNFPGYFLVLVDIVEFCRTHDIYCQGRGSAANSAVCYALGRHQGRRGRARPALRAVPLARARRSSRHRPRHRAPAARGGDPVRLRQVRTRARRAGRQRDHLPAALGAARDGEGGRPLARARRRAHQVDRPVGPRLRERSTSFARASGAPPVPQLALDLAEQVLDFPRHLGIHSGGMVMADRPLIECCPVEWARMENRSVLQWDKDDCAAAGLVKFDLLGLGMLTMLHLAVDLVREHEGVDVDLATIPQEPEVYALLSAADTIGVFQVESRAQMATLPRLRPECFYDLVVEVALIRPGPDPGRVGAPLPAPAQRAGAGHLPAPAARAVPGEDARRAAVPGAAHADGDRRRRVHAGGVRPAAPGDGVEAVAGAHGGDARPAPGRAWPRAASPARSPRTSCTSSRRFADFGFPESHSVSFAYLVYASSWIKLHYPAEFACALLNAQPMGFYSPHTIVRDASRHGVEVLGPCVAAVATRLHAGAAHRRRRARSAGPGRAGTPTRRSTRCGSGSGTCAGSPTRCSTASTTSGPSSPSPTSTTSPVAPVRPPTRSRRSPPRARSRASTATGARRCGPRARCATRGPTSCRAWSPASRRRRCRA